MVTNLIQLDAIPQARLGPIENLDKLGQGLPAEAVRHISKGIKLSQQGKYEEAVASYNRGIKLAPSVPQAWYNLGTALGELGKYSEALKALDQATGLMPDYVAAWHNKGVAFARLGKHEEALEAFGRTLGQGADDAQAMQSIGSVLLAQRKTEEALRAFKEVLSYGDEDPLIRIFLGVTLARLGRFPDANREFQQAYEVKERELNLLAILYKAWAASTLSLGVSALLNQDIRAFERAGLEYIDILEKAQHDDSGDVVDDVLTQYKGQLQKKKQHKGLESFEELELFIKLMKIKNPFEGWRALGEEISKVWPKGLSAVEAVREMRR